MQSLGIVTYAYVVYIFGVINAQQCNDCVSLRSCPGAMKFIYDEIINKTDNNKSKQRYERAVCGNDDDNDPKVCCSKFPEVEDQIEKHRNVALLPETCGDIDGDRIVGGTRAKLFEFPWMALISYDLGGRYDFQCGGSIINERYILTAAHCVKYTQYPIAGVRIGEFDISTRNDCQGEPGFECPIQDIRVEKKIVHPSYDGHTLGKSDIALLRLATPIDMPKKNAAPICLPKTSKLCSVVIDGMNGTVAGWGLIENKTSSSVLMKVSVPIMAAQSCRKRYGRDLLDKKFCAGELNKDSCNGDSGGPLMIKETYNGVSRYVQYGIVSYGSRNCGSNVPGVYTDVSKFVKWILDEIEP